MSVKQLPLRLKHGKESAIEKADASLYERIGRSSMIYQSINNLQISRITLGTAQLGMHYGIANTTGRPDDVISRSILGTSEQLGINCFDTAAHYGDSEQILGRYLHDSKPVSNQPGRLIVTKFKVSPGIGDNPVELEQDIRNQLERSLQRLGLSRIQIYLMHQVQDLYRHREKIVGILDRLTAEGLVTSCGVSVYKGEDIDLMLCYDIFQVTQIPINIMDQRLIQSGYLQRLHQAHRIVFARSVFLQGLFFLNPNRVPANLIKAAPYLRQLQDLAKLEHLSVAQLAFSFVRDLAEVTSLVIGAETPQQVVDNVQLFDGPGLSKQGLAAAADIFAHVQELIINPALWNY
jgi:aryl-alcohol dehydrogenase-like predicted oxidoreductase